MEELTSSLEELSSSGVEEPTSSLEELSLSGVDELTSSLEEPSSSGVEELTSSLEELSSSGVDELTSSSDELATSFDELSSGVEELVPLCTLSLLLDTELSPPEPPQAAPKDNAPTHKHDKSQVKNFFPFIIQAPRKNYFFHFNT